MAAVALAVVEYDPVAAANDRPRPGQFPEPRVKGSRLPATPHYQYEPAAGARGQPAANDPQYGAAEGRALYEEYAPFGTTAYRLFDSGIDVPAKRYRYTGMERDEETGLALHGVRYYAPWLGRWTASDPVGLTGGINRYAYVENNPIGFIDKAGSAKSKPDLLSAAGAAVRKGVEVLSPLTAIAKRAGSAEFSAKVDEQVGRLAGAAGAAVQDRATGNRYERAAAGAATETAIKFVAAAATTGMRIAGGLAQSSEKAGAAAKHLAGAELSADPLQRAELRTQGMGEAFEAAAPYFEAALALLPGAKGRAAANEAPPPQARAPKARVPSDPNPTSEGFDSRAPMSPKEVGDATEVADAARGGIGPVRQGAAGVERAVADLEAAGGRVLGREVTIEAGGVRTRPDLFVELPSGQQAFLEIKTGASAGLTPNQTAAFPQIWTQGGIPRGANAAAAGLTPGVPIGPTPVWTVHYPWPLP